MAASKPQALGIYPEARGERLDSWKEIAAYLVGADFPPRRVDV